MSLLCHKGFILGWVTFSSYLISTLDGWSHKIKAGPCLYVKDIRQNLPQMKVYLVLSIAYINIWLIFANFSVCMARYKFPIFRTCRSDMEINLDPYLVQIKFYTTLITSEPDLMLYMVYAWRVSSFGSYLSFICSVAAPKGTEQPPS